MTHPRAFRFNVSYPFTPISNVIDCNSDYRFHTKATVNSIVVNEFEHSYNSGIQESKYIARINKNGLIEKIETLLNDHLKKINENPNEYSFSLNPNLTHHQPKYRYSKLEAEKKYSGGIDLVYDDNFRLIKHICLEKFDGITYKEYDIDINHENSIIFYESHGYKFTYKFENNLLVEKIVLNIGENYTSYITKIYYENNKIKLIEEYTGYHIGEEEEDFIIFNEPKLYSISDFFYLETDNNLEVNQKISYLEDNTTEEIIYNFNQFNEITSRIEFNENKRINLELNYQYEYDDHENWTRLDIYSVYNGNANLKSQIYRNFNY